MRLLGDSGQIGSFVRGDLLLKRSNSGGVGGFAGICGGLGLLCVGVAGLGGGSLVGDGRDSTTADVALDALGAHNGGRLIAAGIADIDVALAGPVVVAALLAGGVLDAPGAVGLGLVDLPLLGRAGVNGGGAHRCSGRRCAGCGGRFGSLVVGARRIDAGRARYL